MGEFNDLSVYSRIEKCRNLYSESKQRAKEEELKAEIFFEKAVQEIQDISDFYQTYVEQAIKQKQEKRKEDRNLWEWLIILIKEDFFPKVQIIKFKEHTYLGYEGYGNSFEFICNDEKVIRIEIPCVRNISIRNVEYAHWGMFGAYIVSDEYYCKQIARSYNIKDIQEAIEKELSICGQEESQE